MNYQKLYTKLYNGITDTIEQLQRLQIEVEEDYLQMSDERNVVKINKYDQGDGCLVVRKMK